MIDLSERESRIVNVVKAKYGLKDKSQALNLILKRYEECSLSLNSDPNLVKEIQETQKHGKFVKVIYEICQKPMP